MLKPRQEIERAKVQRIPQPRRILPPNLCKINSNSNLRLSMRSSFYLSSPSITSKLFWRKTSSISGMNRRWRRISFESLSRPASTCLKTLIIPKWPTSRISCSQSCKEPWRGSVVTLSICRVKTQQRLSTYFTTRTTWHHIWQSSWHWSLRNKEM